MEGFKRYTHVECLGTEEREGLLDNDLVYVTAKVDGSNGSVWWDVETGQMACASRNFALEEGSEDNAYFRAWCDADGEEQGLLRAFCKTHPTLVVYVTCAAATCRLSGDLPERSRATMVMKSTKTIHVEEMSW